MHFVYQQHEVFQAYFGILVKYGNTGSLVLPDSLKTVDCMIFPEQALM